MAQFPEPRHPYAQPPVEDPPVRGEPRGPAGGPAAVSDFVGHALRLDPISLVQALTRSNQADGTRCTGCSWGPDGKLCHRGARELAHQATGARAGTTLFARYPVPTLQSWSDQRLATAGRLTRPMVRHPGSTHYVPIAWEHALQLVGDVLRDIPRDRLVLHGGPELSTEAAFLLQLWGREWGAGTIASELDTGMGPALERLSTLTGSPRPMVSAADLDRADAIVLFTADVSSTHPRLMRSLARARARGATIVTAGPWVETGMQRWQDPRHAGTWATDGIRITDLYLQLRPGGQAALLHGLAKAWLEKADCAEGIDQRYLDEHTEGLDALRDGLARLDWGELAASSGVQTPRIQRAARRLAKSRHLVVVHDEAFAQAPGEPMAALVALLALGGHLGHAGCGVLSLPRHSNTWGLYAAGLCAQPEPGFLQAMTRELGVVPAGGERTLVEGLAGLAAHGGAFVSVLGDVLATQPDTEATAQALRSATLTVHIDTHLRRSHLLTGRRSVLLPCLASADVDELGDPHRLTVDATGQLHRSRGLLQAPGPHVLSAATDIACLALATLGEESAVDWFALGRDRARVRRHLGRIVAGWRGLERKVAAQALTWAHPYRGGMPEAPLRLPTPGARPATAQGTLALGLLHSAADHAGRVLEDGDAPRGLAAGRRVLWMHPEELTRQGLAEGDRAHLVHTDGTHVARHFTVLAAPIALGSVLAYLPEALAALPVAGPLQGAPVTVCRAQQT